VSATVEPSSTFDAPGGLCEIADTVTEMVSHKHAFDSGVGAMRGIEF